MKKVSHNEALIYSEMLAALLWTESRAYMKSFLSMMKSSAEDRELKHWFTTMKKSAPNLRTQQSTYHHCDLTLTS